MNNTAQRLLAWMKREGLTQQAAAVKLRVSLSSLSLWVRGEREPTGLYREKVERVLRKSESSIPADERGE